MTTIKIEGAQKLSRALEDHAGRIAKDTFVPLRHAAVRVRRAQKALAPRRTGALRKAISFQIRGTKWTRTAVIGPLLTSRGSDTKNDLLYAVFQEEGTARMAAQPYVRPSLDGEAEKLAAELDKLIKF